MFKNFLIKNSLNVLLLRISGIILMFFLSLFLTNSFSAEIVGQYDFVRSSLMILSGASLLGTNQAIIYYSGVLTSNKSFGSIKSIYFKMNFLILTACAVLYMPMLMIEKETILFKKNPIARQINDLAHTFSKCLKEPIIQGARQCTSSPTPTKDP